ncbi:MAG: GNAT family N-acetyltransferase [Chloroflexota bacterium]
MSEKEFVVRPYELEDAAGLAVMWNESDDQWPGTWTNGVPMTEARVRDWLASDAPLQGLVVEKVGSPVIAAFGSMFDEPSEDQTAYVALLNVHPGYQGRSLCRRMLTQMVDVAVDRNYNRLTLGTWSANLKAVPLYKKTGFFWVPDTQVFMVNYIPAIRLLAAGQRFFEKHDWYTTFRRQLEQSEDDQRHPETGDMKVFIYRWEAVDDLLEVVIDRFGQSITGLETNDFAIYAFVDESEPVQGLTYEAHWRIINKRNVSLSVSLKALGEAGIEIEMSQEISLAPGESKTIDATYICQTDARKLTESDKRKPASRIRTEVKIGEEAILLGTGLRYHQAIEISAEPQIPSLLPGVAQQIHLQIKNRLPRAVEGNLILSAPDGLHISISALPFEADANTYTGVPVTVSCQTDSTSLSVCATFIEAGAEISTAPDRIPILAVPLGGLATDQTEEKIIAENEYFRAQVHQRAGRFELWDKRVCRNRFGRSGEEFGTPFYPRDLGESDHTLGLTYDNGQAIIASTITSQRFSGLTLRREIVLTVSPFIEIRYHFVNNGDQAHTFQFQSTLQFQDEDAGQWIIPRKVGLKTVPFPGLEQGDFPEKPADMAERWLAHTNEKVVSGLIWPDGLDKHELGWGRFVAETSLLTLQPNESMMYGPVYVYNGPGDWRDIRRLWQRLNGDIDISPRFYPEPASLFQASWQEKPLVSLGTCVETSLDVINTREQGVTGTLSVQPPAGWEVNRPVIEIDRLVETNPIQQPITFKTEAVQVGTSEGVLALSTEFLDKEQPFTLLQLGDDQQKVDVAKAEGADNGRSLIINNQRCSWFVSPDFHAGLVGWKENNSDVNHLFTDYPDPSKHAWLRPWYGGLRPTLNAPGLGGWPGKLHEESFSAEAISLTDKRSLNWEGVRLASQMKRKGLEGISVTLDYLTLPGSNVLKVIFQVHNATQAYRHITPSLFAYLQVDGSHKKGVLFGEGLQRKRTAQSGWRTTHPWGAVVNPDTERAMVMVKGSPRQTLELGDYGEEGGHLVTSYRSKIEPKGCMTFTTFLALAESLESAKRYATLMYLK